MSRYFRAEILENNPLNSSHNLLVLKPLTRIKKPLPGQFYMIGTDNYYDPLLKRPFCIFRNVSGKLHFIYRIKGRGTARLKLLEKGAIIDALGPLGNSYPLPQGKDIPLIIIGGVAIASAFSLVERLSKDAHVFYGGRRKGDILMLNELKKITKNLTVSTDDGSTGKKGTVVDALKDYLASKLSALSSQLIYACGPSPMLAAVSKVAIKNGIKGYISMEENMACGVGACLGCAVKTKTGYKRVCKEGPVFAIEEIVW